MDQKTKVLENLKALNLKYWGQQLDAESEKLTPQELKAVYSTTLAASSNELAERKSSQIARQVNGAKFIKVQTVDQYDFSYNECTKKIKVPYIKLCNLAGTGQIPKAVFVGSTGLGKTHLARALGYVTCQAGNSVLFTKASTIVNSMAAAKASNTLEQELRKYRRPSLLIIDELGYVTMSAEEGNLFFQVISDRHDRGFGTIVTTNYPFGQWNQIFSSSATAVVIAERLTADAEVFYLEGESYPQNMKKKKKQI